MTQAIRPIPEDMVQYWEGLRFMFFWESILHTVFNHTNFILQVPLFLLSPHALRALQAKMSSFSLVSLEDCRQFVTRSPEFIRIFQASWLLHIHSFGLTSPTVCYIRFLLDFSWDQITTALSALRSVIGGGTQQQIFACTITILALSLELYPVRAPAVTSDLAAGCLRLIQRFGHSVAGDFAGAELTRFLWSVHFREFPNTSSITYDCRHGSPLPCARWSQLLRCSPHSSSRELLHQLEEFVPPWHLFPVHRPDCPPKGCLCPIDVYNVVQWLQVGTNQQARLSRCSQPFRVSQIHH
jgi:hypothetical protein